MKENIHRNTDYQILKDLDSGKQVSSIAQENGLSQTTSYNWRKKYSDMCASELAELKAFTEKNLRLEHIYTKLALDFELAKETIEKSNQPLKSG